MVDPHPFSKHANFHNDPKMYARTASKIRGRRTPFSSQIAFRTVRIYALIRKAVGIGKIGRGPGDQASDDIELRLLGEVVLGLMDRGI